mmetsp:Transcript_23470/g.40462  ORF Transcript_23470/g.40462 Transcript_23470/m.40462 type:complete len:247 (+) Transcript_23470:2416-3156(+)
MVCSCEGRTLARVGASTYLRWLFSRTMRRIFAAVVGLHVSWLMSRCVTLGCFSRTVNTCSTSVSRSLRRTTSFFFVGFLGVFSLTDGLLAGVLAVLGVLSAAAAAAAAAGRGLGFPELTPSCAHERLRAALGPPASTDARKLVMDVCTVGRCTALFWLGSSNHGCCRASAAVIRSAGSTTSSLRKKSRPSSDSLHDLGKLHSPFTMLANKSERFSAWKGGAPIRITYPNTPRDHKSADRPYAGPQR